MFYFILLFCIADETFKKILTNNYNYFICFENSMKKLTFKLLYW